MPKTAAPPSADDWEAHQLRLDDFQVFARLFVGKFGTPIRTIITGRAHRATGRFVSVKAGHMAVPWESFWAELPILELCEAASPIISLLSQPHRLEMILEGEPHPLVYFPDLALKVDRRFAEAVTSGTSFPQACAEWRPDVRADDDPVELVVEVKTPADRRNHDAQYQAKLTLAEEVYRRLGWYFVTIVHDPNDKHYRRIAPVVHEIALDRDVVLTGFEIQSSLELLQFSPRLLRDLLAVLGGTATAVQKAAALHVRRLVALDLRGRLAPDSIVFPVRRGPIDTPRAPDFQSRPRADCLGELHQPAVVAKEGDR